VHELLAGVPVLPQVVVQLLGGLDAQVEFRRGVLPPQPILELLQLGRQPGERGRVETVLGSNEKKKKKNESTMLKELGTLHL